MEERNLKMGFFKSGSGSMNAKANIPITWLRAMGITPEKRDFIAQYDEENNRIIIKKSK